MPDRLDCAAAFAAGLLVGVFLTALLVAAIK